MSNMTARIRVELGDRLSGPMRKVTNQIQTSMSQASQAAEKAAKSMEGLRNVSSSIGSAGRSMSLKVTAPIVALGGFALNASGKMERLAISFESMLGSAEAAKRMVKDLSDFAASTPFQLEGIGSATKQLLSFGVAQEDVMGRLKILGDIAAGADVPLQDMAAIFGKAKAKGKAMTEELLQLSDRGVPIIDVLAKQLNKPKQAIFDLASKGKISFEILAKAMESMTQDGGIFADQMSKQSESLFGLFSTLKDNVFNALVEIGNILVETFHIKASMKGFTEWLQSAVAGFKSFSQAHPVLTKIAVVFIAMVAAIGPLLMIIGQLGMGIYGLSMAFAVLKAMQLGSLFMTIAGAVKALSVAMLTNPIGLIITAIAIAAYLLITRFDDIKKSLNALLGFAGLALDYIVEKVMSLRDAFLNVLPDWIKEKMGIDIKASAPAAPAIRTANAPTVPAIQSAYPSPGGRRGRHSAERTEVGGALHIKIDSEGRPKVSQIKRANPDFDLDVDAGLVMAGG